MPSNQKQIIEQAKFTYSPLGKAFEKQTKTIEFQEEKQVDAVKSLEFSDKQLTSIKDLSEERLSPELISKLERIEEEEEEKRLIDIK